MENIYIIVLVTKDGAELPLKAYRDEKDALSHYNRITYQGTDETGYPKLSTVEMLGVSVYIRKMLLY